MTDRPERCTCGWWPETEDEYFDALHGAERQRDEAVAALREAPRPGASLADQSKWWNGKRKDALRGVER